MRRLLLLLLWSGLSHAELAAELPDGGSGLDGHAFSDTMSPQLGSSPTASRNSPL